MSHSNRVRELAPSERAQCEYPSERMLNQGGCNYGSPAERAQWRVEHMERRRKQGWPSGRRDPSYCARTSKWMIDGECLCSLHAGAKALDIMSTGAEAPPEETTDMTKATVATSLGLAALLEDGGALANLRGHARRIAEDIGQSAEETGGDPWRSPRYKDAKAVTKTVGDLEAICDGTYKHAEFGPTCTNRTRDVLGEVERERDRQRRKGYDEAHDDRHADGEIAWQAAHVLAEGQVMGQRAPWINPEGMKRRAQLIVGIALAVAEVERLDRASDAEELY